MAVSVPQMHSVNLHDVSSVRLAVHALQQHPELVFERVIRKHKANVLYLMFLEKVGGVRTDGLSTVSQILQSIDCSAFY